MSLGISGAWAGETLVPGAGNGLSGVLVLIVTQPVPVFLGNMNGPLKVAPASSRSYRRAAPYRLHLGGRPLHRCGSSVLTRGPMWCPHILAEPQGRPFLVVH